MRQIRVKWRGPLRGELIPPPDKSISHRAIMLASLANGKSITRNILHAEDPRKTQDAFTALGIRIDHIPIKVPHGDRIDELVVYGKGLYGLSEPGKTIDCGNSGTTMRLLSGILAAQPFSSSLSGDASLRSRPMERIITPLSAMGASIESDNRGYPPLKIFGGSLHPITYSSPIASAQVKSAILLAGLYCDGTTTVVEPGKSRDHTERMLQASGARITTSGLQVTITGVSELNPLDMMVPGDLSSAAFFIVAALLVPGSEILIKNTGINPTRRGIIDILRKMGADIKLENEQIVSGEPAADIFVRYSHLNGIDIDGNTIVTAIDEFPVLCIAASCAEGSTRISGAQELRVKESDRIASMTSELRNIGVTVEELEDGLIIEGSKRLIPSLTDSHGDHRIAMSLTIAGLLMKEEITINNTECVNTSFPRFIDRVQNLVQQ